MSQHPDKFEVRETFGICNLPPLLWQKSDQGAWGKIVAKKPVDGPILDLASDAPQWMAATAGRRVVLQAGGNMGMYPRFYEDYFDKVITFEPDEDNFYCLDHNCQGDKYEKYQKGLGAEEGTATLAVLNPINAGMHRVVEAEQLPENYPKQMLTEIEIATIDSLNLEDLDLLHLDVELYELAALQGGEETIKRCQPTIVVETGGRMSPAHAYLDSIGYRLATQLRMDAIYLPK
jgi:FkbM family methyltransferase